MPHGPRRRAACLFASLALLLGLSSPVFAQAITYEYDALGRLILVSAPEGIAHYEYDAVGNILRIRSGRYADTTDPVALLMVAPTTGPVGTEVHLYGKGFSPIPGSNQLAFNGTPATVTAATAHRLVTTVPAGATTGPVTVTAPQGSATSADAFTVLQALAIVPEQTDVVLRGVVSFQATLAGAPTAAVTWRVNGVVGGNASVGTISPTGYYTAPTTAPPVQPVPVEAVLTADPTQIARASVRVVGQAAGLVSASAVSLAPAASATSATAAPVSLAPPLTAAGAPAAPVSVMGGPVVTGVTPATGAPGAATLAVTVTGTGLTNLTGTPPVQFLRNGAPDPACTVTAATASPDGTQVTLTLTIAGTATQGSRVVRVGTTHGATSHFALGGNTFTVAP